MKARSVFARLLIASLLLSSCKPAAALPTPTPSPKPHVIVTSWATLIIGTLVNEDGCLRVQYPATNVDQLLLWPADYSYTIEAGQLQVVSGLVAGERKETVLPFGETVQLGGGEIAMPDEQLLSTAPERCPGPYWVVGDVNSP